MDARWRSRGGTFTGDGELILEHAGKLGLKSGERLAEVDSVGDSAGAMQNSFDDEDRDDPNPRDVDEIQAFELSSALRGLAVLGDDPYLGIQAFNISAVDKWLMYLEKQVRIARFAEEEKDLETELLLGAISQMWLFAIYELLRTWRERAKDIRKWSKNGGIPLKIAALEKDAGYVHPGREALVDVLKRAVSNPAILAEIDDDLARTHITFRRLEFLRIALAKHEVSGKGKQLAYAPGYARIDSWTGSLSYQLSRGRAVIGELKRRDIADELRSIVTDRTVPSKQEIEEFDSFMNLSPGDRLFE